MELPKVVGDRTLLKAPCFARTEGYYPPELSEGLFSPKSDMYLYGVVGFPIGMHVFISFKLALDTYTGQKAYDPNMTEDWYATRACT